MLIGIVGNIGSGKDTIANYLITKHNFKKDSFAANVKKSLSVIFGWDLSLLEGDTIESREWREQVDEWWATRLNIPHLTPRWVMTYWATDMARNMFHNDIWIASLEKRIGLIENTIISDARFINEITAIKNNAGIIIRVTRGEEKEWVKYAKLLYSNNPQHMKDAALTELGKHGVHRSEYEQYFIEPDYVIQNNGSVTDLYSSIDKIISQELNHPVSTVSLPDVVSVDSWRTLF